MASAVMNGSKEDKVKDLLEDLDLQKLIYDDLLERRPGETEESAEVLETIRQLESQIAELLADAAPSASPRPAAPVTPPQERPAQPPPAPTNARPVQPAAAPPAGPPRVFPSNGPNLAANDVPPAPYWPSSAPSPFAAPVSQCPGPSGLSTWLPPEASRKRPRHDSHSSPIQKGPSKKTFSRPEPRLSDMEAELQARLAENKALFEELRESDTLAFTAVAEGISESEVLAGIQRDQDESERIIRAEFQMEKDAEFARMLQAQEDYSEEDSREPIAQPSFNLPDRTLPSQTIAQPSFKPPGRTQAAQTVAQPWPNLPGHAPPAQMTSSYPGHPGRTPPAPMLPQPWLNTTGSTQPMQIKSEPPYNTVELSRPFYGGWDNDLQEIPAHIFNPAYGGPPAAPRPLPWMKDSSTGPMLKAFDLIREQEDPADFDEDDLTYAPIIPDTG